MNENIVYPACKKCGKSHGMGIEEMATGKITSIDVCYECLWGSVEFNKLMDQEILNDVEEMKKYMEKIEYELIKENE